MVGAICCIKARCMNGKKGRKWAREGPRLPEGLSSVVHTGWRWPSSGEGSGGRPRPGGGSDLHLLGVLPAQVVGPAGARAPRRDRCTKSSGAEGMLEHDSGGYPPGRKTSSCPFKHWLINRGPGAGVSSDPRASAPSSSAPWNHWVGRSSCSPLQEQVRGRPGGPADAVRAPRVAPQTGP